MDSLDIAVKERAACRCDYYIRSMPGGKTLNAFAFFGGLVCRTVPVAGSGELFHLAQ